MRNQQLLAYNTNAKKPFFSDIIKLFLTAGEVIEPLIQKTGEIIGKVANLMPNRFVCLNND
jgi:hypothetical protein